MSSLSRQDPRPVTPRYASLPLISLLLKLMGFLCLGFGGAVFFVGIYSMIRGTSVQAFGFFVLWLFVSLIVSIVLMGLADLIHVLLDIEDNTRRTADAAMRSYTGSTPRVTPQSQDYD